MPSVPRPGQMVYQISSDIKPVFDFKPGDVVTGPTGLAERSARQRSSFHTIRVGTSLPYDTREDQCHSASCADVSAQDRHSARRHDKPADGGGRIPRTKCGSCGTKDTHIDEKASRRRQPLAPFPRPTLISSSRFAPTLLAVPSSRLVRGS